MPIKQQNAQYEVLVPHLGKDVFVFSQIDGSEFVSNTFKFRITMITEDKSIKDDSMLRKPVVITLRRKGVTARVLHGLISNIRLTQVQNDAKPLYYWEATVVPWLWFLNLEVDCRHFINMTAVEIVKKVFTEHGYTDFTFKTSGSFPKREFTVQYRESSFNFISRLLADEGIFYWFEHSASKHQMILANANSATQNSPLLHKLKYDKGSFAGGDKGMLEALEQDTSSHTGKLSFQDYNFEKSNVSLFTTTKGDQLAEVYDYPGNYSTKEDGERYAKLRLEEQEARLRTIHAQTGIATLIPGYRMEVEDHYDKSLNTSYIVLSSTFSCRQNIQGDEVSPEGTTSTFNFSAIPYSVPYRPPRKYPKPMIHGVQTAIVCGAPGNEIYCDEFGRVKVQFHWDRLNQHDDNSSFWIRMSTAWAGAGWGQISLPRIGQEVIVSFLEGDPDRPIITGRVYNDQQMPPYTLPDNKTQSGVKSRSSTWGGSNDFNEFRFEDKAGSEQIYLHAQKDYDELIENKHTITVQESDQIIVLERGNRSITLEQGNTSHMHRVGNHELETTSGKIMETAGTEIKMVCGASSITLTPASIKLEIGGSKIEMGPAMITMTAPMIKQN